ncbi:MAG: hypothetical protein NVS4B7_21770 [Ktedonobacteraceae bacterium]
MDRQQPSHSMPLPQQPAPHQSRGKRLRSVAIRASLFLAGMVFGIIALLLTLLVISGNRPVLSTAQSPQRSDILIQAGNQYITHLIQRDLQASGLVNTSNVTVTMAQGDQMTISGDEQILFGVSRPFSVIVQPIIRSCQLEMHVLHADLAGIPITSFIVNFEGRINQELFAKSGSLPNGFEYCKTSVRTDPRQGLFITFSAKPV